MTTGCFTYSVCPASLLHALNKSSLSPEETQCGQMGLLQVLQQMRKLRGSTRQARFTAALHPQLLLVWQREDCKAPSSRAAGSGQGENKNESQALLGSHSTVGQLISFPSCRVSGLRFNAHLSKSSTGCPSHPDNIFQEFKTEGREVRPGG